MTDELAQQPSSTLRFRREVADRFGVLPNFFCSADAAPGLVGAGGLVAPSGDPLVAVRLKPDTTCRWKILQACRIGDCGCACVILMIDLL
jgi:hypothetical protein